MQIIIISLLSTWLVQQHKLAFRNDLGSYDNAVSTERQFSFELCARTVAFGAVGTAGWVS
jgi:hypothetical protein